MPNDLNTKSVIFQALPVALGHALREHLHGVRIDSEINATADTPPDLVVSTSRVTPLPGIPCLHVPPRARLGQVLADMKRALDEPALAVMPFALADGIFYPAEKKLERTDNADIALTERETLLLLYLARHAPRAVSREALLRDVWRYQDGIDTHTLETHIYRLRQKIEHDSTAPAILVTTTEGYRLDGISPATPDIDNDQ